VPPDQLDGHIARRIAVAQTGDPTPEDLRVSGGRIIRSQCTVLPSGGRMLTYTDVTDLVQHAEQLETLATTDGMTGLANRRHFLARAEAEWTRFQRYHRPLSLMVFDLDHLKSINDGFGHDVGDRALERVADLSVEGKRSPDLVARTGGDEFAALLPETDLAQAKTVAERLRRAVAASPIVIGDARIALTVSIGLAEATLSMPGADALMKLADQSLYQAKSAGRNRIASGIAKPITGYNLAAE
jgi:diguanylate cyclase (GGDEF)-like protein